MNKYVLKIVFKPLLMRDSLRCSNQFREAQEGDVYTARLGTLPLSDEHELPRGCGVGARLGEGVAFVNHTLH